MKMSYYPGCSLHSTAVEYDRSTRKLCEALDVELVELKDWVCCGSTPAHQSDELMSVALPVKNINLAADDNLDSICVPCSECYSRMKIAQKEMEASDVRNKVEDITGGAFADDVSVLHVLDALVKVVGHERIAEKVSKPLNKINVVCYYGCLITRPAAATGRDDDFELPMDMENLLKVAGVRHLDWNSRTFCCGASAALTQTDVVYDLTNKILLDAESVGADAVIVGCPLCHANLDGRQEEINAKYNTGHNMPVIYLTQILGLAMGVAPDELGLHQHLTDTSGFIKKIGE